MEYMYPFGDWGRARGGEILIIKHCFFTATGIMSSF
jgi:hypothetical protein